MAQIEESGGGGDAARFQLKHQPDNPKAMAGWALDHDRRLLQVPSVPDMLHCDV